VPDEDIELLKSCTLASDYFSRGDHIGGPMIPGSKYYRAGGKEHRFEDVPFPKVLSAIEGYIKRSVPADRRTDVYHKVLAGTPIHKKIPEWTKEPLNPNGKPATPFST
jgi:hypothetical protein